MSSMKRDAILAAARATFADTGYDGSSLRGIARAAAVDPALVLYFFRSKAGLFQAALDNRFQSLSDLEAAVGNDPSTAAAAWARVLHRCSSGPDAPACRALLRSFGSPEASRLAGEAIRRIIATATEAAEPGDPETEARVAHALSHLFGWLLLHDPTDVTALARRPVEAAVVAASGADPHERPGEAV